jgi:hypothetical protein
MSTTTIGCCLMPLATDDGPEHHERGNAQGDFLEHHGRESETSSLRRTARVCYDTPCERREPYDQQVEENGKRASEHVGLVRRSCGDPTAHQGDRNSAQPLAASERRDLCANYHAATVAIEGFPGEAT